MKEFNSIGFVPIKKKNEIQDRFKKALDTKFETLKLTQKEKSQIQFNQKLEELKSSNNPKQAISREQRRFDEEIRKLESTIQQYENNLGFFGHSKGAQKLKAEVESKLEFSRTKLKELKEKRKAIKAL